MALVGVNVSVLILLLLKVNAELQTPLNFTELATKDGYKSEEHIVTTDDGYVLNLFRITRSMKCKEKTKKTPVFFMPPLLSAADTALESGPNAATPYLISDTCFDTWIGNPRGTYYGRKHLRLDPDKDKEFWAFSVDEIGGYDVPALVDYVLNYTKVEKLLFIGFSQGGGSFFVMCSERPGFCPQKIKLMIGLAPATRHLNAKSQMFRDIFQNVENNLDVFDDLKIWEVLGRDRFTTNLRRLCKISLALCEWLVAYVDSAHPGSVTPKTYLNLLEHFPAGTSVQNMVRFSQSLRSQKFYKFSYGRERNEVVYGRSTPPAHNLTAANVPILLISGLNDMIVDIEDVKWVAGELPNVLDLVIVEDPLWNHVDMFYSQWTKKQIYPKIQKYLLMYDDTR